MNYGELTFIMFCRNFITKLIISILFIIYFSAHTFAQNDKCLSFSSDAKINNVKEFISFFEIDNNEINNIDVFSSNFDLNDDGKNEYFYYLEIPRYCGIRAGCQILVYNYHNGIFIELFEYGLFTNNLFDPREKNKNHTDYICISGEKDFGWRRIVIKGKGTFKYNNSYYILTK